ncbi:MAG: helix-turn-helix domain-containing protein [Bacteroidales bacterium]|nr:helix-turn-helix domain-containing protein [Bacteroidales bacterium]
MKFIRQRILVPESHSFMINKLDLSLNTDKIHSHKNYELNYIINGWGRRFIGGSIARFEEGDLVLIGPNLPHGWEVENPENTPESITLHFQEEIFDSRQFMIPEFESLHKLLGKSSAGICFKSVDHTLMLKYLNELRHLNGFDSMIHILLIMRYLTQVTDTQVLSASEYAWNKIQSDSERINKVYDYVLHNFQNRIKLKDVADQINLSESAFFTYFKKTTKKSFFTFLKEIKIGYACKLLSEGTEMNVTQVCYNSGYNNVSNFNRQLRELTNMSPREYRKKYTVPQI